MIRPIDGNALLAQEKEWAKDGGFYTSIYNGFQKRIQDAPTLDYAPVRHAYWVPWIEDVEIYNTGGFVEQKQIGWKCSGCKDGRVSWKRTYCPDCGALMDGDSNNGV